MNEQNIKKEVWEDYIVGSEDKEKVEMVREALKENWLDEKGNLVVIGIDGEYYGDNFWNEFAAWFCDELYDLISKLAPLGERPITS